MRTSKLKLHKPIIVLFKATLKLNSDLQPTRSCLWLRYSLSFYRRGDDGSLRLH